MAPILKGFPHLGEVELLWSTQRCFSSQLPTVFLGVADTGEDAGPFADLRDRHDLVCCGVAKVDFDKLTWAVFGSGQKGRLSLMGQPLDPPTSLPGDLLTTIPADGIEFVVAMKDSYKLSRRFKILSFGAKPRSNQIRHPPSRLQPTTPKGSAKVDRPTKRAS
jgi:hypothetical protein